MAATTFDHTELFKAQIEPLAEQIAELCRVHKINHALAFDIKSDAFGVFSAGRCGIGRESSSTLMAVNALLGDEKVDWASLTMALREFGEGNVTITCEEGRA